MLAQQVPAERSVLEAEHARQAGAAALVRATTTGSTRVRALAARGLGRLEDTTNQSALVTLTHSSTPLLRAAAFSGLAQMRAGYPFADALRTERDGAVRAMIFEAIGRATPIGDGSEGLLRDGLRDASQVARAGAARGLEAMFRLNRRAAKPDAATMDALRAAFASNISPSNISVSSISESIRQFILLTLIPVEGTDARMRALALRDPSAGVRRLGVLAARTFVADPSPMVRYEGLKFLDDCDRLAALVNDASDHVSLGAIERLGRRGCAPAVIERIATTGRSWRTKAAAWQALMLADTSRTRAAIAALARDTIWQVRANAGAPARLAKDFVTLAALASDVNPNVALTALYSSADVERALQSDHAGLLLAAAQWLEKSPHLPALLPRASATFARLTAGSRMTMRDARVALLTRIGESSDTTQNALLRSALSDRDPAVASVAARALTVRTGTAVAPLTTRLPVPPLPSASYIAGLMNATARITMKGLGTITVALLTEDAPVTVATFAQLAESGQYTGLTFHRIVPNFVIQGGSPGADEYDGRTEEFLRDEVGMARQLRGTIGISTRGRDTGDGQLYFNLIDNFRLDRDYTVMARMISGLDVMDRVQEGDIIAKVEIIRRKATPGAP